MWLVTAQNEDSDAVLTAGRLRELGLNPVEVVVATDLVHGARWAHRVGRLGNLTTVRLADGREIDSGQVRGVLNRLLWITADGFTGASSDDREYAGGELYALVQSWLESLGTKVINRPAGIGLCGPWRTPDQWRAHARQTGLRIRAFPEPTDQRVELTPVLVLDGQVVEDGGAPADVRAAARRLAVRLDHDLVEFQFDADWRFADATLHPALAYGGEPRVQAVAAAMRARAT